MRIEKPPDDNIWSFRIARDFLRTFQYLEAAESPSEGGTFNSEVAPVPYKWDTASFDPKSAAPSSLGDFTRLFEFCGLPVDPPLESSSDPPSTSESTAPDDVPVATERGVRWKDDAGLDLTESRRRSSHNVSLADDDSEQGDVEGPPTPTPSSRRTRCNAQKDRIRILRSEVAILKNTALVPASILPRRVDDADWPPPPQFSPIPVAYFDQRHILPLYTLTREEQEAKLKRKLRRLGSSFPGPIHVFIDCSNIMIGLYERLKLDRDMKGSAKAPPVSYKNLANILERGRRTVRRVLVGSHNTVRGTQLPAYLREARKCGYELNILEPVIKPKVMPSSKAKNGRGNGYATTSGHSSGSETFSVGALARAEQAVDELLQMKMLESLLDSDEPATMVLASGDAAEAEYSGGFLKTVERALKKGWKVEVLAWKNGLSFEYRSAPFLDKWNKQFEVIELDDFSEEMLAIYTNICPAAQALY